MSEFNVERFGKLNDIRLNELVTLAVKAFTGDCGVRNMTGDNRDLEDPLFRAIIRAGNLKGQLYGVTNEQGKAVSFALWFPPGCSLFDSPEQRALGLDDFLSKLEPEVREWWTGIYGDEFTAFLNESLKPKTSKESWYFSVVATDPNFQRQGLATRIIRTMLSEHKGSGDTFALACNNKRMVSFYENINFKLRGTTHVTGTVCGSPAYCLAQVL